MKTKHLLYLAMGALVTFSCTNDENEGDNNNTSNPVITPEYTNPQGFNYSTSRNVNLSITSPLSSEVSIYTEEDRKEEHMLVHNLKVSKTATPIELNIPIGCNTLYLYAGKADKIGQINVTSTSQQEVIGFIVPEDFVAPTNEQDAGFTFYHNTGVAMFEDNWPNLPNVGIDDDYNDVVLEYDLKVTECNDESKLTNEGYKEGLLLTLDIRAIGGKYPTTVGVVLGQLDAKYIKEVTTRLLLKKGQGKEEPIATGNYSASINKYAYNNRSYTGEVKVDLKSGIPVITLNGLGGIRHDNTFYQTTEGYIVPGNPMLRAEIKFNGLSRENRSEILKAYKEHITDSYRQNFFIIAKDTKDNKEREIHMKGYKPTYLYESEYEKDAIGSMMKGTTYCSQDGYVWALKVPVGTKHAYENIPLSKAYTDYNKWLESKGVEKQDWYKHPTPGKVVENW